MISIKALIICGFGINCEKETAYAFNMLNVEYKYAHLNELLKEDFDLGKFHIIVFPGGFSFADELGAGKAFANKLKYKSDLKTKLAKFVDEGKCILGICNGFQVLSQLGFFSSEGSSTLKANIPNYFVDKWVKLKVCSSKCIFLQGINSLYLPIRHAEGRFFADSDKTIESMFSKQMVALKYSEENPNGSLFNIAGVCDTSGRVFGLMPHPEAALFFESLPNWTVIKEDCIRANTQLPPYGPGLKIFKNALNYLKEKFNGKSPNTQHFSKCY